MRRWALLLVMAGAGSAWGQTMVEYGSAAAVGSAGGAGGKKISEGITSVFGKVNQQTKKAATTADPAMKVGPGVATDVTSGVPAGTTPSARRAARKAPVATHASIQGDTHPQIPMENVGQETDAQPLPPKPVVKPAVKPEDLKKVATGMNRDDVLKLGEPASRITMDEGGHLVEIYSYREKGERFGTVRLSDGAVSSVEAR